MISDEEYCLIWEMAYFRVRGGKSLAEKDRDFIRMINDAETCSKNSSIAPHVCRITRRNTKINGKIVTVEERK